MMNSLNQKSADLAVVVDDGDGRRQHVGPHTRVSVVERLRNKELKQPSDVIVTEKWRHLVESKRDTTATGVRVRRSFGHDAAKHVEFW